MYVGKVNKARVTLLSVVEFNLSRFVFMTRAACNLLLHVSILRHSWRSIQALKHVPDNSRDDQLVGGTAQEHIHSKVAECDQGHERMMKNTCSMSGIKKFNLWKEHITLLQLWSIFAFHKLFIQTGLEMIVSLFPFYYYIKLILILVTVHPDTGFANYWFESILVPLMDHIHALADLDWPNILRQEIVLFPYTILQVIIFPGIFSPIEESPKRVAFDELTRIPDFYEVSPNILNIHAQPQSTVSESTNENASSLAIDMSNSTPRGEKKLRKKSTRQSPMGKFGEKIRELVVGDKNIRLRDYLFDLKLPPSPQNTRKESAKVVSPHYKRPSSNLRTRLAHNCPTTIDLSPVRPNSRIRQQSKDEDEVPWIRRSQRLVHMTLKARNI
jgi:hypothetical protein